MKELFIIVIFFVFFTILLVKLFHFINNDPNTSEIKSNSKKPNFKKITIEPYGCFINLKEQFFQRSINPYSKTNEYDAGIIITDNPKNKQLKNLIIKVIENGYDKYGNEILKKYDKGGYEALGITDIAILGKLDGYDYLSIYKNGPSDSEGVRIYLTYSPPMVNRTENVYGYDYNKEEYESLLTKQVILKNIKLNPKIGEKDVEVCGYPCLINNKPDTYIDSKGVKRQYMCGSVNYPDLRSDETYAVYKIITE